MNTMGKREKIMGVLLTAVTAAAIVYSLNCLLVDGVLSWHVRQKEYVSMMLEVTALLAVFTLILRLVPSGCGRAAGIVGVMAAFLWIHVILIPIIVSGLYAVYIWAVGARIRAGLRRKKTEASSEYAEIPRGFVRDQFGDFVMRDFLMGSMTVICVFGLMSAAGLYQNAGEGSSIFGNIGSIPCMCAVVIATGIILLAEQIIRRRGRRADEVEYKLPWMTQKGSQTGSWLASLGCAFVLAMFCLQAGRMNVAVDYDSLWYGARSQYILNNGHGIYENMGTMAVVYTYSKGLETLMLPLSVLPSYSFMISFNLWLAAGVLWTAYRTARHLMDRKLAVCLVVFLASIPGIMNMTITAKTDIATLFFQLIMIEELLRWLKGEKNAFGYSLAAFLVTWTLKPTALVFSTAVYGMGWFGVLVIRYWNNRQSNGHQGKEGWIAAGFGLVTLAFMWARTLMITGLPVTSVFSSIFTRVGFTMKYPYSIQSIPNSGAELTAAEWMKQFLKRVYGVLLNPSGEDMNHVIIAWGSLAVLFMLLVWLVSLVCGRRKQEPIPGIWLYMVFLPFMAGNLLSLAMLNQVDGNYFMLFYVLLAMVAFRGISSIPSGAFQAWIQGLAIPVMVFSAVMTGLTNWSWTVGFMPIDLIHRGYYDHQLVQRDRMAAEGNAQIWNILEADPESRLIAIGTHPDVLAFPCNVQSYDDITGTNGNVMLVKTMDQFVEFMRYAQTDYVYVEAGWMEEGMRASSLTRDLIEYGVLVPVCYESGNVLAAVDTEGQWSEESSRRLQEFLEQYRYQEDV